MAAYSVGHETSARQQVSYPGHISHSVFDVLGENAPLVSTKGELDQEQLWKRTTEYLKSNIDAQVFSAWIKPLSLDKASLQTSPEGEMKVDVVLSAPNKFSSDHVASAHAGILKAAIAKSTDIKNINIKVVVAKQLNALEKKAKPAPRVAKKARPASKAVVNNSNLNPNYNFTNFVVGSCNQLAHAISEKVSAAPGKVYNPLFIYGGVGLGKTHLANAIGNHARRQNKKVLLVSSEIFVNELITALRAKRMHEFKDKFRNLDMLIIDDVQFLIGKEKTQEEFIHTFNALHQSRSQIVITADKVPQELNGLEERLKTRFSSGLAVDLQAPDFDTRVAILQKKTNAKNVIFPKDVAQLLAEKIDSNIRELEGALNRLLAFSSIHNQPITIDLAQDALKTIVPQKTQEITIELIQSIVAEEFSITRKDLLGKRRTQNIALPRQVAMYICRKLTSSSYPEIGVMFGGRDHSTVIHAFRSIESKMQCNNDLKKVIQSIEKKIKG